MAAAAAAAAKPSSSMCGAAAAVLRCVRAAAEQNNESKAVWERQFDFGVAVFTTSEATQACKAAAIVVFSEKKLCNSIAAWRAL
jgi:hypothetical protein